MQQLVSQLSSRVSSLEQPGVSVSVDCAAGQSIRDAIQQAPSWKVVFVSVSGVCQENVPIQNRARVILQGATPDAEIAAPPGVPHAIFASGGAVSLSNLSVRFSGLGVAINVLGAKLNANDLRIVGGVSVSRGSTAEVFDSQIDAPPGAPESAGILVEGNSYLGVFGSTIGNFANGIRALQSVVEVGIGTTLVDNSVAGLLLEEGSSALLRATVSSQTGVGVDVRDGSTASVEATLTATTRA